MSKISSLHQGCNGELECKALYTYFAWEVSLTCETLFKMFGAIHVACLYLLMQLPFYMLTFVFGATCRDGQAVAWPFPTIAGV